MVTGAWVRSGRGGLACIRDIALVRVVAVRRRRVWAVAVRNCERGGVRLVWAATFANTPCEESHIRKYAAEQCHLGQNLHDVAYICVYVPEPSFSLYISHTDRNLNNLWCSLEY